MDIRDYTILAQKNIFRQWDYLSALDKAIQERDTASNSPMGYLNSRYNDINFYLSECPLLLIHPRFANIQSYFEKLAAVNNPEDMNQVHYVSYKGMRKYVQENILNKYPVPEDTGILSKTIDDILREQDCKAETKGYLRWLQGILSKDDTFTPPRTIYQAYTYIKKQKPGSKTGDPEFLMSQFLQALDDSTNAYKGWGKKYWHGLDYSCHPGLVDRVQDVFIPTLNSLPISEQPPIVQATQYLQQYISLLVNTADPDEMTLNAKAMALARTCLEEHISSEQPPFDISTYKNTVTVEKTANIAYLFHQLYKKGSEGEPYILKAVEELPPLPSIDKQALHKYLQGLPPIKGVAEFSGHLQQNPFTYEVEESQFDDEALSELTDFVVTSMSEKLEKLAESDYIDLVFRSPTQDHQDVLNDIVKEIIKYELSEIDSDNILSPATTSINPINPRDELKSIHVITDGIVSAQLQLMKQYTPGSELKIQEPVSIAYVDISEETKAKIIQDIDDRFPRISTFDKIDKLLKMGYRSFANVLIEQDGFIEEIKTYIAKKTTEIAEKQPNIAIMDPLNSAQYYNHDDIVLKLVQKLIDNGLVGKMLEISPYALINAIKYNKTDISDPLLARITSLDSIIQNHRRSRGILHYAFINRNYNIFNHILGKITPENQKLVLSVVDLQGLSMLTKAIHTDIAITESLMAALEQLPEQDKYYLLEHPKMSETPLMAASYINNTQLMQRIWGNLPTDALKAQALTHLNRSGGSALFNALKHSQATEFILTEIKKLNKEAKTIIFQHLLDGGQEAIKRVISNGSTESIKALLAIIAIFPPEQQTQILAQTKESRESAILIRAISSKNSECFNELLNLIRTLPESNRFQLLSQQSGEYNENLLMASLSKKQTQHTETLITIIENLPDESKASILTQANESGDNILMQITQSGTPELLTKLLSIIKDLPKENISTILTQRNKATKSILEYTIYNNLNEHFTQIMDMIKEYVPEDLKTQSYINALQTAINQNSTAEIECLFNVIEALPINKAQVLVQNGEGAINILTSAIRNPNSSYMDRILKMAKQLENSEKTKILTTIDDSSNLPLLYAAKRGKSDIIEKLASFAQSLPRENIRKILEPKGLIIHDNPLMAAIDSGEIGAIKNIIAMIKTLPPQDQAAVLTQQRTYRTPLTLAIDENDSEILNELLNIIETLPVTEQKQTLTQLVYQTPPLIHILDSAGFSHKQLIMDFIAKKLPLEVRVAILAQPLGERETVFHYALNQGNLAIVSESTRLLYDDELYSKPSALEEFLKLIREIESTSLDILLTTGEETFLMKALKSKNTESIKHVFAVMQELSDELLLKVLTMTYKEVVAPPLLMANLASKNAEAIKQVLAAMQKLPNDLLFQELTGTHDDVTEPPLLMKALESEAESIKQVLEAMQELPDDLLFQELTRTSDEVVPTPLLQAIGSGNTESVNGILKTIQNLPTNKQVEVLTQDNFLGLDALGFAMEMNDEKVISEILAITKSFSAEEKSTLFTENTRTLEYLRNVQDPSNIRELAIQLQQAQSFNENSPKPELTQSLNEILAKVTQISLIEIDTELLTLILSVIDTLPPELQKDILMLQDTKNKDTLLTFAINEEKHESVIAILNVIEKLDHDMQKDIFMLQNTKNKDTPLTLAINEGERDSFIAILKVIEKLNHDMQKDIFMQQDVHEITPLMGAAFNYYDPEERTILILEALTKLPQSIRNEIVEYCDKDGCNTLMYAVSDRNIPVIEKLLKTGSTAIITNTNNKGENAFMLAMIEEFDTETKSIATAVSRLDAEVQKAILLAKDTSGETCLEYICSLEDSTPAEPLLSGNLTDQDWQELFKNIKAIDPRLSHSSTSSPQRFIQKWAEITSQSATHAVSKGLESATESSSTTSTNNTGQSPATPR